MIGFLIDEIFYLKELRLVDETCVLKELEAGF